MNLFEDPACGELSAHSKLVDAARGDPLRADLPSQVFFDLNSAHPNLKQLHVSLAAPGVSTHDVAVSVRHCTYLDIGQGEAHVALDDRPIPAAWTLPRGMVFSQFCVCLCEWEETQEMVCNSVNESLLHDIGLEVARDLFMRCMDAGAFLQPGEVEPHCGSMEEECILHINHGTPEGLRSYECAEALMSLNFVQNVYNFASSRSAWVVTQYGQRNVRYDQKLSYVSNWLAPRQLPYASLQSWEFLQLLLFDGWKMYNALKGVASKALGSYIHTVGEKRFFVRDHQTHLCKPYLFLLLVADEKSLTVPHLCKASVYIKEFAEHLPEHMKKKIPKPALTQPFHEALEDAQRQMSDEDVDGDEPSDGDARQPSEDDEDDDDDDGEPGEPPQEEQPQEEEEEPPQEEPPQLAPPQSSSSDSGDSSSNSSSSSASSDSSSDSCKNTRKASLQWPNHMWGNVLFSYKPMNDSRSSNQWVVTCPFCPPAGKGGKTRCTRTLMVVGACEAAQVDGEADVRCRQLLKFWVVGGRKHKDKAKHQRWPRRWHTYISTFEIPQEDSLVQLRDTERPF